MHYFATTDCIIICKFCKQTRKKNPGENNLKQLESEYRPLPGPQKSRGSPLIRPILDVDPEVHAENGTIGFIEQIKKNGYLTRTK